MRLFAYDTIANNGAILKNVPLLAEPDFSLGAMPTEFQGLPSQFAKACVMFAMRWPKGRSALS